MSLWQCVMSKEGQPDWDEDKQMTFLARAQTVLNASVSKYIRTSLENYNTPFEAFNALVRDYGENEVLDNLTLWTKLTSSNFRIGYNRQRYLY